MTGHNGDGENEGSGPTSYEDRVRFEQEDRVVNCRVEKHNGDRVTVT